MGLYLLARYVRIYQPSYTQWSKSKNLLMYISLSTFTALMLIITCYFDKVGYFCMFWTYTSPLVIAGALYLLLSLIGSLFKTKESIGLRRPVLLFIYSISSYGNTL